MVSQRYRNAAYPQETGEDVIVLLTITHPDMAEPELWTDSVTDIVFAADLVDANGTVAAVAGTYTFHPFSAIAPGQSENQPRGTIRMPNIDQAIGALIDEIHEPAEIIFTVVLASDPSDIISGPYSGLELSNTRGDATVVEGEIGRRSYGNEPWPRYRIGVAQFKAMGRL